MSARFNLQKQPTWIPSPLKNCTTDSASQPGPHPLLLDVREPTEHQVCQIGGSQLIPMQQIPTAVESASLNPQQEIIVICHHGVRSQQVAYYLEENGFQRVVNLHGGIDAWAMTVEPAMPRY